LACLHGATSARRILLRLPAASSSFAGDFRKIAGRYYPEG
jgi:hypothetical protein